MTGDEIPTIRGLDRRALLRTSLLAGFGAVAIGGASTLLTGTASAAQPAGVNPPGPDTPQQFDWGWCNACAGLFFAHNETYGGVCPAIGSDGGDYSPHALVKDVNYNSYDYGVYYDGSGTDYQPNWCYCGNCRGLYHQGSGSDPNGECPAQYGDGPHVNSGYAYVLYYGSISGVGQPNWLWCSNCYGIFFASDGATNSGWCPIYGGGIAHHDGSSSWSYQISYNGSIPLGPS